MESNKHENSIKIKYSYDSSLKFHPEYRELILKGKKTATIRYSNNTIRLPRKKVLPIYISSKSDSNLKVFIGNVEIIEIKICKLDAIEESDAIKDGFENLKKLIVALKNIYPNIDYNDFVTVYSFVLNDN